MWSQFADFSTDILGEHILTLTTQNLYLILVTSYSLVTDVKQKKVVLALKSLASETGNGGEG